MTKLRKHSDILSGWDGITRPAPGETYQHYKGPLYTIIETGFLEDTEAPCVIYKSNDQSTVWVRTAKNFLEIIEHKGSSIQRFTLNE